MTFGEKLKDARKQAGLSQEQLAEKMSVSRSAVAKWETNKGIPDVENLKALSRLLNVSIDYLLDEDERLSFSELKEAINLEEYEITGSCRSKEDAVVLAKYKEAEHIYPLIRRKKLSKTEWILDFFMELVGAFELADSLNDNSSYYLVEYKDKQYLVNVTKEFMISRELSKRSTEKKFVIGANIYTRCPYQIVTS